jgi:hypothetical protein
MSVRQTVFVALLTALYLCFELAFNARLLDVVGSAASSDQIHHIEVFGRSLSGVAVALVVLQLLLGWRHRKGTGSPRGLGIVFWCLAVGLMVFGSLQLLVDQLVARSSPEFRRAGLNIVLVQRALVNGGVQLDGLDDDPTLFAQPAGKAFLALFPAMAVSVERLDEKIRDAKLELISRQVHRELGGAAGYYAHYVEAVRSTQTQWQRYQRTPGTGDLGSEVKRRQDQAWSDYLADLGRRGWTPSTVPPMARNAVLHKVRARVPVSPQWNLADETAFRDAVAMQVRRKAGAAVGDGSLTAQGRRLPPGLAWPAFFAHSGVQAELHDKLRLPASIALRPSYSSGSEFDRLVFTPLVREMAKRELQRYEAPAQEFADNGRQAQAGLEAARAVIVPPVALFFSLLGAVGHLAKFTYLLLRLAVAMLPTFGRYARYLWVAPLAVLALVWAGLSATDNTVTRSRLHVHMVQQLRQGGGAGAGMLANALHVVAVGQGFGYPINEAVRTRLLGGMTYGYQEQPPAR